MSNLVQQWTEKLADWRGSGLSIAAWCRHNGEGYHRFLYWRKGKVQGDAGDLLT